MPMINKLMNFTGEMNAEKKQEFTQFMNKMKPFQIVFSCRKSIHKYIDAGIKKTTLIRKFKERRMILHIDVFMKNKIKNYFTFKDIPGE